MYKKGTGNDKQKKTQEIKCFAPYRNFSQAIKALTDLCQHMLNTCTVLNCVTVLKFDMPQQKCKLSCTFTVSKIKNLPQNLTA